MKKKKPTPATTHFPNPVIDSTLHASDEKKIKEIEKHFHSIMKILGLDLNDPSLERTPYRVAKMYVTEVFSGLKEKNFPSMSFVPDTIHEQHKANIVLVKVTFTSFCEHHFVPFHGKAYIAYLPRGKLIGLSKIPRLVRYFAKRPQIQERLTAQIADSLSMLLDNPDVAVSLIAEHFCVIARGVEDEHSHTVTNVLRGAFNDDPNLRREFFEGMNRDCN